MQQKPVRQQSEEDVRGNEVQLQTAYAIPNVAPVNIGPAFPATARMNIVNMIVSGQAIAPVPVGLLNQLAAPICTVVMDGAPVNVLGIRNSYKDPLFVAPAGSTQLVCVGPAGATTNMTITYYIERS